MIGISGLGFAGGSMLKSFKNKCMNVGENLFFSFIILL